MKRIMALLLVWNLLVSVIVFVLTVVVMNEVGWHIILSVDLDTFQRRVSALESTGSTAEAAMSSVHDRLVIIEKQTDIVTAAARGGWRQAHALILAGAFDE